MAARGQAATGSGGAGRMTGRAAEGAAAKAGIRRVAETAGVSVSTVSRALNGYADVNPATRARIAAAAEELGYRPSYAAAMLRRNQTDTVTFMVSKPWTKFVDPFFLGILDGLELALSAQGFDLQVVMARDYEAEHDVIRRVVERQRSDALIFARTRPQDERIDWLEDRGFPFVTIGQTLRNSHSFIDRDQRRIGREAAHRLAALGHRRIAFLSTPHRYTYSLHTREGFHQGLAEAGLSPDAGLEIECFLSRRTGEEAVTQLFTGGASPTALFCGNDMIALSAMEGLKRLGMAPGQDVALIGCDDSPLAAHVRPALTSFRLDQEALGIRLGRMILARLGGDTTLAQDFVRGELVLRESDSPMRPRGVA
jgi:LacI family transcriptional regulator